MALYISQQNQELLWNLINTNTLITNYFTNKPINHKHEWFKSIINIFYQKYMRQPINVSALSTINKETISYMIQDIRNKSQDTHSGSQITYNPINTPEIITNNRRVQSEQLYNERVKDYELMNTKVIPTDINFSETKDEYITDMDSLLKKHIEQRNNDIQPFAQQLTGKPPSPSSSQTSIKIMDPINIVVDELPPPITELNVDKKTVSWDIISEINELKNIITQLQNDIEFLKKDIEISKTSL
jgi:uncharacterized protein YfkK (UPF0435 family)